MVSSLSSSPGSACSDSNHAVAFIGRCLTQNIQDFPLRSFVRELAQTVQLVSGSARTACFLLDRFRQVKSCILGHTEIALQNRMKHAWIARCVRLLHRHGLLESLNVPISLSSDQLDRLLRGNPALCNNHPALAADLIEVRKKFDENGFDTLFPLLFENQCYGYFCIGGAAQPDLASLETLRRFSSFMLLYRDQYFFNRVKSIQNQAESELQHLRNYLYATDVKNEPIGGSTLVYKSRIMHRLMDDVQRVSGTLRPALITGETGTGKELIARLISVKSPRPASPFVAVNCAAIPASLWEDELFGHIRGAFTDAKSERIGRIAEAEDGILFFDEIGELPVDIQPKLLRVLQENKFSPVGASRVQDAGCRFVFATNRDLAAMTAAGQFRADLYYRIAGIQLHLPPLRERRVDIPAVIDYFLGRFYDEFGPPLRRLEIEALETLINYEWPGNIRELENVLVRAVLSNSNEWIKRADLNLLAGGGHGKISEPENVETSSSTMNFDRSVNDYKRKIIKTALEKAGGNKSRAAQILGIGRHRLRNQITETGLE